MSATSGSRQGEFLYTKSGVALPIGRELGRGGQGRVVECGASKAAKIYKKTVLRESRAQLHRRVKTACDLSTAFPESMRYAAAWPIEPLYNQRGGFVGFSMLRCTNSMRLACVTRSLAPVDASWGHRERLFIAISMTRFVAAAHAAGVLIGDLSSNNVLVMRQVDGKPRVAFIDVDSYELKGYPCPVRTTRYKTPSVLRGKTPDVVTEASDCFSLAILLFEVLVGISPFAHRGGGAPSENVRNGFCPYVGGDASKRKIPVGEFAGNWERLSPDLRRCLGSTFREEQHVTAKQLAAHLMKHASAPRRRGAAA